MGALSADRGAGNPFPAHNYTRHARKTENKKLCQVSSKNLKFEHYTNVLYGLEGGGGKNMSY
jgi:hypothetical protein